MTTSLWLMDNGFFAVRDSAFDTQPDTATWTRLARYDETAYPVIHARLSDNVKNATWANGQLTIDGQTVIDSEWIADRQAELTQAGNIASVQANAKAQAAAIPNWASWSETDALLWHDTNITNALPVANLAAANVVLSRLATENRALLRMVIALRNQLYPDLQDN